MRYVRGARVVLSTLLIAAASALAATGDEASALGDVRENLANVERLLAVRGSVRSWESDGLDSRIDQIALDALRHLNRLAPELLASAGSDDGAVAELNELLDTTAALALAREQAIEERAATERELYSKFEQSAQADIARAFMDDLMHLRLSYLAELAKQTVSRQAVGTRRGRHYGPSLDRVTLILEQLTGQIRLDAMSLEEMRDRLSDKPLDEDLQRAVGLVRAKQSRNLEHLDRIVDTAATLGIETAEQRSLLIRQRGQLGVELLEGEVFGVLWEEQVERLRESLVRNGPNALFRLCLFLLVLLLAWVLARLVRYPVQLLVRRERFRLSQLLRDALVKTSSFLVFLAGVVAALAAMGVSLGPLFAGLGVLSIIVGFAVQDSLGNLAAGVMILVNRPFDIGDHIQVSGADGLVRKMNLLATTVATVDNQLVVVPNRKIWGDTIANLTASHVRRVDLEVSCAYSEDPDRVLAVLLDVLEKHENVLEKPEPIAHVQAMADSAVTMMVKPWVRTEHYWATLWDLKRVIKKRFDEEGIEIPFPQRVVTLRSRDDRDETREPK